MENKKSIFDLLSRTDFTYRKGDEALKSEYMDGYEKWYKWCEVLAARVSKFDTPIIQSWQNSGQLARYFWTRLKYTPYLSSPACVALFIDKSQFNIELSYEIKNESSNFTRDDYNKLLINYLPEWVEKYNIDKSLNYIRAGEKQHNLYDYFKNQEVRNWFANTKGININIGVLFDKDEIQELETVSEEMGEILINLSYLYEKVHKPNNIYDNLKKAPELIPDKYDGSYELVRETVRAFKHVPYEELTLSDLDAMFFMCIGTFKHGAEAKKQLIEKSNLPENEKKRIRDLIDAITKRTMNMEYTHTAEGIGHFGMFGEAVGSLRASYKDTDNITGAKDFIKMCISISKIDNEETIFNMCESVLKAGVKGMQTGKISKFLHCLKPFVFPIINERQGTGTSVYDALGIKLNKVEKAANYIENARIIKSYRDRYFSFKNYRVMDIVDEKSSAVKYWLGGAKYQEDMSNEFIEQGVFGVDWMPEDIKEAAGRPEHLEKLFEKYGLDDISQKTVKLFFQLKAGDKIALKSAFATRDKKSILRIKAIGTVQGNMESGYVFDKKLVHTLPVQWEIVDQFDLEDVGGYWKALAEVTKLDDIQKIFNRVGIGEGDPDEKTSPLKPYTTEQFLEEAFIDKSKYDTIKSRLERKKNIILQGAPGVGKSFLAKRLAYSIIGSVDDSRVQMIQFHQSYSYEDFIMGYRPNKEGGFNITEGVFYKFCKKAIEAPDENFYFIIDEINRGNLSKVFGELMLLIEADKRGETFAMPTVYNEEAFYIPDNIYIIGLMNTADRSLALIDYALRRRFSFIDIEPAFGLRFSKYTSQFADTSLKAVLEVISRLNEDIEKDESLGKGFKIGHSYFCNLKKADKDELKEIINCEIIPLLEEYWVENNEKVKNYSKLLNEAI